MNEFLTEVLSYNEDLKEQGFKVVVGVSHTEEEQMHFIYTAPGGAQHELLMPFNPTDYTAWNALKDWVKLEYTRSKLPDPSEVLSETISVPYKIDGYDEKGKPQYSTIEFTKQYKDGQLIGWK